MQLRQSGFIYSAWRQFIKSKTRKQRFKVWPGKAFAIDSSSQYDEFYSGMTSMFHKVFDKKTGDTTHTGIGN